MQESPARTPRPQLTVLQATLRNLPIVLLPVILLVGAAVAIGLIRSPEYTSEARLSVGGLNLTRQSIPGYTTAVQQLAVAYSRAIAATGVVGPVAKHLRLSPADVVDQVSATPIQGSPVVRVIAHSDSPREAVRLADASADSVVRYADQLNSGTSQSQPLLRRYIAASRAMRKAQSTSARLKPGSKRWRVAQTRQDIARLRLQTSGALYGQSQVGQATTNLVQKLAPASAATSDRSSVLERLAAGGLIAGLLIGVGLAVLRANRLSTRRLREG